MKLSLEHNGVTVSFESGDEFPPPLTSGDDCGVSMRDAIEAVLIGHGFSHTSIKELFGEGEE